MQMRKTVTCALVMLTLTGCTANGSNTQDEALTASVNGEVIDQGLADSTKAMAESLRILYEIQNAKLYQNATAEERERWYEQAYNMPDSLKLPVTVNHHGDAEAIIRQIARMARYKVEEPMGRRPADRPIVKIKAQARPAYDILRDIASQVSGRLLVKVMPSENPTSNVRGIIELEYL